MSVVLNVNGVNYTYPETGDTNWGVEATSWAQAVTTGMLQKAGGLFLLLQDVDFGANYGLVSTYYKSRTPDIADGGALRLAHADSIAWRNNANDGNLLLGVDASDELTFNGSSIGVINGVANTNSIDLTINAKVLTADLNLSAEPASTDYTLVDLSIEADGLKAEIEDSAIFNALPIASSSLTGLLSNTDWSTFNAKQTAGNYITSLTGDVTASGPGASAATIAAGAVSLAKMANLAANSIIGNNTGSPATPVALNQASATALLNAFVGDSGTGGTKGMVPAPGAGDGSSKFLKANGSWATVPTGTVPTMTKLTSGSGTYSLPVGCTWIRVRMAGGGGGGSGFGKGTPAGAGAAGTGSYFRVGASPDLLVCGPGGGATQSGGHSLGGSGGTASLGSITTGIAIIGQNGGNCGQNPTSGYQGGAPGGNTPFFGGGGGFNMYTLQLAGQPGRDGTGGGGAAGAGGVGQPGEYGAGGGGSGGYVEAIITSPASSYQYSVGTGGAGGNAAGGTGVASGGNGGTGIIIIEEYYF